jgi:hypothetical protein
LATAQAERTFDSHRGYARIAMTLQRLLVVCLNASDRAAR